MNTPEWTRLDNAALIYPTSATRNYPAVYRMSVRLAETVDAGILDKALKTVIRRFPAFRYTLGKGLHWWFLSRIDAEPAVSGPTPLKRFSFRKNGGYLFKVSACGREIVLDVFHSLTDGTGSSKFLMTLAGEYLRLAKGIAIQYSDKVLDPSGLPDPAEFADAFDSFSGRGGELEKDRAAYHISGHKVKNGALNNFRVVISEDSIRRRASAMGCSVTDLLVSLMIDSIQKLRASGQGRRSVIKVSVPVNLRNIFPHGTLRNFSSYVNLGVDVRGGSLPLDEIVREVSLQKQLFTTPSRLASKVAANVNLEDNLLVRCLPRVVKSPVMAYLNRVKGDRFWSQTLSNLGVIELPEAMRPHVESVDFMLGRQLGNSGACACVTCNGRLVLNCTRRIEEYDFEQNLLDGLHALGIDAELDISRSDVWNRSVLKRSRTENGSVSGSRSAQFALVPFVMMLSLLALPFTVLSIAAKATSFRSLGEVGSMLFF